MRANLGVRPSSVSASTCSFGASLSEGQEDSAENPETVGLTCQEKQGLPALCVRSKTEDVSEHGLGS